MDRTLEAAKAVVSARLSAAALDTLPASVRPRDVAEGYRVQHAVHEMLARTDWGPVVGHKIGCTTSVMQQYLRISHPCAGGLFSGRIHQHSANLSHAAFVRPGMSARSRSGWDGTCRPTMLRSLRTGLPRLSKAT